MSKITVIGAGSVGSTIANDLMIQGTASEIVLIDVNKQKAFGEAMDIYQGAPFCSPTIVRSGDYDAASGSDIVIITSGLPRKAGQSRLELAQANVNIIKDIAPQITAGSIRLRHHPRHQPPAVDACKALLHQPEECPRARLRRARRFLLRALEPCAHREQPY